MSEESLIQRNGGKQLLLSERRGRGNLLLFKGIVIGLYGNWLFSALDKIDFERLWGTIATGDALSIDRKVFKKR